MIRIQHQNSIIERLTSVTRTTISRYGHILVSPFSVFLILALAIMGPLLAPGLIFGVDSPLAINWDISGYIWGTSNGTESVFAANYNSAPIALFLTVFDFLMPFQIVEKLWLVFLLWICGIGAYHLPHLNRSSRYYAGLLYVVNPFTYIRFVTGQWGILGAYSAIPFAITAFIRMLEDPRPRHAIKTVFLLTLIGFLQVHGLALALLILLAIYIGRMTFLRGSFKQSLPMLLICAISFLGINSFWLIRYIMAGIGSMNNMPIQEMAYFAAGPPLEALSLRGFWLSNAYTDISDLIPVWWVLFAPLLFLAIYGAINMAEDGRLRWLAFGLSAIAIIGVILAAGPSVPK